MKSVPIFNWFGHRYIGLISFTIILIIGLILRLYNISAKELWYDEAFSAYIITNSYLDIFSLSKTDVHPPLFYFLLKAWTYYSNSELMLRLLSVVFGIALIPLSYYLSIYIDKKNKFNAYLVALVIAVNPFLVAYSKEARSNSMLSFLTVLSFFLFLKAYNNKRYLLLSIFLPILFLTHYITIFIILVFSLILILKDRHVIKWLLPVCFTIIVWIPIMLGNSHNTGLNWIPPFSLMRLPESFQAFVFGVDTNKLQLPPALNPFMVEGNIVAIVTFISIFILILFSKKSIKHYLLLASSIVPIALIIFVSIFFDYKLYVERYLIGYATLIIIYCVIALPRKIIPILFLYIALSVCLVFTQKVENIGYINFKNLNLDRPIVMVDATEFINARYYNPQIKLQEGDWSDWGIIKENDILKIKDATNGFYLVNRDSIKDTAWKPKFVVGEFYFYEWK